MPLVTQFPFYHCYYRDAAQLRAAIALEKKLILVIETEAAHGALSVEEAKRQVTDGHMSDSWSTLADGTSTRWQSAEALWERCDFVDAPARSDVVAALERAQPIEWSRLRAFQEVTLRQVIEQMLPTDSLRKLAPPRQETFR